MKTVRIILYIFIALILISGTITVFVKGFNVSLDLRQHDTLKFVFDQKFKMDDVKKICDDVFKKKKYEVKTVEVFSDAVYIISSEINQDEEKALLEKLNDLYVTKSEDEAVVSDSETETEVNENVETETEEKTIFDELEEGSKYELYHDSKVRIRDIVKPYIIPSIISTLIILVYVAIKYRKLGNWFLLVCKTLVKMFVLLWTMLSLIAVDRIIFTRSVIPIMMFIMVIFLCIEFSIYEKKLKELED